MSEQEDHINILEMRAILLGLQSLCSTCSNTHIRVKTDNQTCVAYVNKFGGSKSTKCNLIAKDIWNWCIENDNYVSAEHVAGVLNEEADYESRHRNNSGEWSLSNECFNTIVTFFNITPSIVYIRAPFLNYLSF